MMRASPKIHHRLLPQRLLSGQSGATLIEYAIILPVFLAFLLGIMDTGRLIWTYNTLHRATDTAARCAAVNATACETDAQIKDNAVSAAWGLSVATTDFAVARLACGVEVSASYEFQFVTPGLTTMSLSATSCYPE
jgi:Flp pilus assembly protein TadG